MTTSNIPNLSSMSMVKAKVDLYKGSTLVKTCTCGDVLSDFTVTREGDTSKFFGFGICHKLDLNLIDLDRELTVTKENTVEIGLGDGGELWDAPYPTFYIAEAQRDEKSNSITATAYDKLYWASEYLFKDLGLEAPYTLLDVAQAIATKLGISFYVPSDVVFDFLLNYENGANLEGTEDLRSVLNWIAEATQTIYYISKGYGLYFKRLDRDGEAIFNITKDDYYELNTKTPRTLTLICHTTELGDNLEATTGDGGAIQYIRNNPFLELRTDLTTILDNAITNVGGTVITQFDCDWVGNYLLEIGDKLALETENGGTAYSYLLSDTITYAGTLNEVSSWEYTDQQPETYANPTNIGDRINQTFARVNKIEKNITLYVGEVVEGVVEEIVPEKVEEMTGGLVTDVENLKASQTTTTENLALLQLTTQKIAQVVEQNDKKIIELESEVDGNSAAIEINTSNIGSLQVSASQINASVSSVEQKVTTVEGRIEDNAEQTNTRIDTLSQEVALKLDKQGVEITVAQKLEEGVDKVVTSSKKYTFDDEGLNISAPDSEFSTEVTDNGMRIYKSSQEVLVVNNDGVQAADLHARTFLIIGENSRLEDRGSRTACFWIGPAGG
jgi:hypothetical protein